jgi:hypothetical protein
MCGIVIPETGQVAVPIRCFACAGLDSSMMSDDMLPFVIDFGGGEP